MVKVNQQRPLEIKTVVLGNSNCEEFRRTYGAFTWIGGVTGDVHV